jgi:hypothetical protein
MPTFSPAEVSNAATKLTPNLVDQLRRVSRVRRRLTLSKTQHEAYVVLLASLADSSRRQVTAPNEQLQLLDQALLDWL